MFDPASREEEAKREMARTAVAPATVRLLVIGFLAAITVIPLAEWSGKWGQSPFALVGQWGLSPFAVVSANRALLAWMQEFERGLEDRSRIGRALRPRTQRVMTRWLGAGNERVYRGRDGWLFYRPDVEYVTGRPFLDPAQLARRVAAADEWDAPPQPDPRRAIARLNGDLAARGVTLIVMPTPLKPTVHPEMLAARYVHADRPLQNAAYPAFVADLARDGVLVFDPAEPLFAARRATPQYLAADTHWRPESMEMVADGLAAFITRHVRLPAVGEPGYRLERVEVRNQGDTARMLDLPEGQTLYPPESVWLRRVLNPDGSLWRSMRNADVLVLGDSFSNIYTLESMGWGTSAGFVEQLSYTLRRPVDRLLQNDDGAFATREILDRDPARLDGKRVVVYQFAARELTFGDWRVLAR